jgi:hypothetical protein
MLVPCQFSCLYLLSFICWEEVFDPTAVCCLSEVSALHHGHQHCALDFLRYKSVSFFLGCPMSALPRNPFHSSPPPPVSSTESPAAELFKRQNTLLCLLGVGSVPLYTHWEGVVRTKLNLCNDGCFVVGAALVLQWPGHLRVWKGIGESTEEESPTNLKGTLPREMIKR